MLDKNNSTSEADKQLTVTDANRGFKFSEKTLQNLFEESKMKILDIKPSLQIKNSNVSPVSTRKLGILRKFSTYNVSSAPGRPAISNCLRTQGRSLFTFRFSY